MAAWRPCCWTRRLRPAPCGVLLSAAVLLACASAWDKDGHEAVGMTTMSALDADATAEVKHLMGGRDAVDVAAWAHKVNKKYPWTEELHFQKNPPQSCTGTDSANCPDNKCLLKALKHFYGRLVNQQLASIDWGGLTLTDADAVKFLINLIGDLHQPLHVASLEDNMGRNLTVSFRGKRMSLYDLWDHELTQAVMADSPGFWWGGWTHVHRTRVEYEKDGALWKDKGVAMFDKWADETADFLCNKVYKVPMTGQPLTASKGPDGAIPIGSELFEVWKREMLSKMLVAGARTAIVLNAVLKHREGTPRLHAGTALRDIDGEDEGERKVPSGPGRAADGAHGVHLAQLTGPMAALLNIGIFALVGAVFLQVMRRWQGRDSVIAADREKHRQGGKNT